MKHILNAVKCLSLLAALLVWSSCTEEMEKGPGKVVEGIPTTVRFAINLPKAEVITTKSLESGTGDDRIDNLYLIAFKEDGRYETCEQVQILNDKKVLFHVESGKKYIYAIANASNGAFNDITTWITEDVMEKKMDRETFLTQVVNLQNDNVSNISGAGLMVGGFCLTRPTKETEVLDIESCTINPSSDGVIVNSGAIWLQRMRSEVIFHINGNSNFSLISYEIRNVPRQSALFYSNDINPSNSNEGYFNIEENVKSGQNQFSFYMLENTLKPENSGNITSVADREKSENYPTYSTYVVLKGTYKGKSALPGGGFANVDATVTYNIHLGKGAGQKAADHSDFSTYRNKQYIYNITVTGVSSIIAEVESNDLNDPRAEGDVIIKEEGTILYCDAHYETRVISFKKEEITEGLFYTAKTPFGDNDIDWVKFYRNEGEQQDVAANYTDVKSNHSEKLMDVKELLDDLNAWNIEEKTETVRYYTCFVNEFFYENESLSTFVNAEDRTLLIGAKGQFQDINIGNSSVLRGKYTFKQRSIKSIFKLDDESVNPWGIETWNETGKLVFGKNDKGNDLNGGRGDDSNNGYNNQIKFVDNINNNWTNAINYSFITESINNSDVPEYNLQPNKDNSPYAFTGAMFACMQRNRDENGNGEIDDEEVKWYLPASNQYITLWMGADALKDATLFNENTRRRSKDNHYYTSTFKSNVYWSEEGITAQGNTTPGNTDLQGVNESGNDRQYRCVRNLRSNDGVSKIFTVNEESNLLQVRPTNLVEESLRKEKLTKEIDSANGHLLDTDDSNRPYKGGFEYYTDETVKTFYDQEGNTVSNVTSWLSFYNNANAHPENSYCAQYMKKKEYGTGWRMPSQRELALMFMSTSVGGNSAVSRTLHAIVPPNTAGNKRINDGSEYGNLTHTYVWGSGHSLWEAKDTSAKLRCVRDL